MPRSLSLVAARKDLGRIVAEVSRTGDAVRLTRRGKVVARIVPENRPRTGDALATLSGTAELVGSFADLTRSLRELRLEGRSTLEQRVNRPQRSRTKRRV
jgi:antitoxin (DNA-binding transcriptional repressor) of toxin-antitoxin stability system